MSKIIIVKKEDGGIVQVIPNHDRYGDGDGKKPYSECKGLKPYEGLQWMLVDEVVYKPGADSRKQIYWEDINGVTEIKKDTTWDARVMPPHIIKKKFISKKGPELDTAIANPASTTLEVIQLQREIEKAKTWTEVEAYEKALEGLDARVAGGEADKPVIRQKLTEKILEVKNADKK